MNSYTKEDIAFIQLRAAIELFKQNNFIAAITLAGAAEELFAVFLKQEAKTAGKPVFTRAELDAGLFELTKDFLGIDNFKQLRNQVRNELKHHGQLSNYDNLQVDFPTIALMHISGAISNYKLRTGHLPQEKLIQEYCVTMGIS